VVGLSSWLAFYSGISEKYLSTTRAKTEETIEMMTHQGNDGGSNAFTDTTGARQKLIHTFHLPVSRQANTSFVYQVAIKHNGQQNRHNGS
jgi:hypothetical protein